MTSTGDRYTGTILLWFERKVTPALEPHIPPSVEVLGPSRTDNVHAGIATARAVIAAGSVTKTMCSTGPAPGGGIPHGVRL